MTHEKLKHKKFLAAALTLIMLFALAIPAFAEEVTYPGSITINKPDVSSISISEQTFNVYRILNLTMSDSETPAYAYTFNSDDFADFDSTYTANGETPLPAYVGGLDATERTAFAKAVWEWIYNDGDARVTPHGTGTVSQGEESVTITDLPLGYYLVYGAATSEGETVIAACALTNADPDGTVILKADAPTITKQVSDNATDGFGAYTDLNIGDTAYFKLTSAVPNMNGYTSYTYTVHDTLSAGLTFNSESVAVKVAETISEETPALTANSDYTVATTDLSDDEDFNIVFDPGVFITYTPGHAIEITYTATLNASAVVAGTAGNPNEVYLEYSNNPYDSEDTGETPESEVFVYTFKFDVFKYTLTNKEQADGETNRTALSNAEFELYPYVDDAVSETALKFTSSDGTYTVNNTSGSETLTSPEETGTFTIKGLDKGEYDLVEMKAPDGYNKLAAPITIKIDPVYDGTLSSYSIKLKDGDSYGAQGLTDGKVLVKNETGALLPESGGIGRTIFTVVGLLLMFGACVILIARRKTAER
jgi:fimbrial isopeptide formation D2 family protein